MRNLTGHKHIGLDLLDIDAARQRERRALERELAKDAVLQLAVRIVDAVPNRHRFELIGSLTKPPDRSRGARYVAFDQLLRFPKPP